MIDIFILHRYLYRIYRLHLSIACGTFRHFPRVFSLSFQSVTPSCLISWITSALHRFLGFSLPSSLLFCSPFFAHVLFILLSVVSQISQYSVEHTALILHRLLFWATPYLLPIPSKFSYNPSFSQKTYSPLLWRHIHTIIFFTTALTFLKFNVSK